MDTIETLQYIDGLNRTIETVKKRQHHINSYDIIHALEYDNQGRVEIQYEPQKFIGNGAFLTIDSGWDHTLNDYEESPLNRLESTTPPSWYPSTMEYGSNSTSDSVYIDGTDNIYGDDLLYKKTSIDGNGNKSIVFTDKKGRTILQRRTNSSGTEKNDTYSIYDDKDRLIMVIPPGADTVVADHLGNTRLVFSDLNDDESIDSSEILQRLHYYPFGLRQKGSWRFEQTSNIILSIQRY